MARKTLAQMETELNEWGCRIMKFFHRNSAPSYVAKVNDGAGWDVYGMTTDIAIGINRSDVIREAYAEMQAQLIAAQAPAETVESLDTEPETPEYKVTAHRDGNYSLVSPSGSTLDVSSVETTLRLEAEILNTETKALQARIEKLEADNAAYEAILLKAAQDFEALKAENARMIEAIASAYGIVMRNTLSLEHAAEDKRVLSALLLPILKTPAQIESAVCPDCGGTRAMWAYTAPYCYSCYGKHSKSEIETAQVESAVTLTDDAIEYLSHIWNGEKLVNIFPVRAPFHSFVQDYRQRGLFHEYALHADYDTTANRTAIEAKRKARKSLTPFESDLS